MVQSLTKNLEREAYVNELIEQGIGRWKENLINETFNKADAETILVFL